MEQAYRRYNRKEFISPDPLETLYRYRTTQDREVVGLLVSSIAYGRVGQILRSADRLLHVLGPAPADYLVRSDPGRLASSMKSFRHRFTSGDEMGALLAGVGAVLREWGTLENFLGACLGRSTNLLEGLGHFARGIRGRGGLASSYLLPAPEDGSACKRLFLFLKWMVRSDDVDPGGWSLLLPRDLLVPLDVHMFRICSTLGLTGRRQANLKTAVEVTHVFRSYLPEDPVKYDFVLTRYGIRPELSVSEFLESCRRGDGL